jgi:carbohydrate-binding DOMON domain-containing protein
LGQQQLLLIVLAIIIVGIAIAISIQLFRTNAIEAKRDILIEETTTLGLMALQYFKKPAELGGGSKSFLGWTIPSQMVTTANGNFMTSTVSTTQVIITGTGTEVVTGTDSIEVQTTVTANEVNSIIIN